MLALVVQKFRGSGLARPVNCETASHAVGRGNHGKNQTLGFELANLERALVYREDAPIAQAEQELMRAFVDAAGSHALSRSLRPFDVVYARLDVQRPVGAGWVAPPSWRRLIDTLRTGKSSVARYMTITMLTPLHHAVRHALNGRFPSVEKPIAAVAADPATH